MRVRAERFSDFARPALQLGWSRERILEIWGYVRPDMEVTQVERDLMVLDDRWLVYRGAGFEALDKLRAQPQDGRVTVWGDGSGTSLDKPAGIGVVIDWPNRSRSLISENIGQGTNNRAELMAIWRGLQEVPDRLQEILVRSDSEYAIGSVTKPWSPQKNQELIASIRMDLSLRPHVSFEHVKGHAGIEQNELCDRLAKAGRTQQLPD